jgi:outer membrane protein assembly factor BamB
MKKSAVLLIVILFCQFCSLFKAKVIPYPSGVIFPMEKDQEISYEGEIISPLRKKDHFFYFSTRKGKVYCVDGLKREMLWQVDIPASLSSPPYLAEDRIYVNDSESTLYCVDLEGNILYKIAFMSKITSGIGVDKGQIFVGTEKGLLYCLSAETGQVLWQFQADDAVRSNPVIWQDTVLFGCDDHQVYFLDKKGGLSGKLDVGGRIGKTLSVDENLMYFGTDDRYLQCVNLKRQKIKWKIHSGGVTYVPPVVAGKRIFFLCWNCVLYCLNKNTGTILWWNSVPSRSFYRIEVIDARVVVTSFSPELVSFDIQTGESTGSFDASQEIKSNPLWFAPFMMVNLHNPENDTGTLMFLKKEVKTILSSSRESPRKQNEEIAFTARETGFYLPKYEFFLTRYIRARFYPGILLLFPEEGRKTVQASSESPTWEWFPEEEGSYYVEVIVTDERENAQAKIPFIIQERIVEVSLSASLKSPQKLGQEIVFTADESGSIQPQYEFHLSRLKWVNILSDFFLLFVESEKIVQDTSEVNFWTWIPGNEGLYVIRVFVQDEQETATSQMAFAINKEQNNIE